MRKVQTANDGPAFSIECAMRYSHEVAVMCLCATKRSAFNEQKRAQIKNELSENGQYVHFYIFILSICICVRIVLLGALFFQADKFANN